MFINETIFEKLTSVYENAILNSRAETTAALNLVLSAKDSEVKAVSAIKDQQIQFLREEIQRLRIQVDHEAARASSAIDQLLVRAENTPVAHADLQRLLAEKEVGAPRLPATAGRDLKKIFSDLNSVLGDENEPEVEPTEKLMINGARVA